MKKLNFQRFACFVMALIVLPGLCLPVNAEAFSNSEKEVSSEIFHTTYDETYTTDQLIEMALNNEIVEDENTHLVVTRSADGDGELLTISLTERKAQIQRNNSSVETYVAQTISVKSEGSQSTEEWNGDSFSLTAKVTYDKIKLNDTTNLYKITRYDAYYDFVSGRYEFKNLEMDCGCSGLAYLSKSEKVGAKSEHSSWSKEDISPNVTYYLEPDFTYYYSDSVYPGIAGATATLSYIYSNNTHRSTLEATVTLFNA